MIRYKLQKKFLLKLLSVFFLFISFSAICYEPYKQTKKNNQDEKFIEAYTSRIPIGRMANSEDYIGPIVFLSSKASNYMTGANLVIDGGWTSI